MIEAAIAFYLSGVIVIAMSGGAKLARDPWVWAASALWPLGTGVLIVGLAIEYVRARHD